MLPGLCNTLIEDMGDSVLKWLGIQLYLICKHRLTTMRVNLLWKPIPPYQFFRILAPVWRWSFTHYAFTHYVSLAKTDRVWVISIRIILLSLLKSWWRENTALIVKSLGLHFSEHWLFPHSLELPFTFGNRINSSQCLLSLLWKKYVQIWSRYKA